MKITQIRNATQIITYHEKKFLIDPVLAPPGAYPGFEDTLYAEKRNPMVPLPFTIDDILSVDAVIVTHTHLDHWDDDASRLIPKNYLVFVQNEEDRQFLASKGFTHLKILSETSSLEAIHLIKTPGQHGYAITFQNPEIAAFLGQTCGVIFQHPSEKTLYLAGDTL